MSLASALDMRHVWPYVYGGYGLTAASLGAYVVWLQRKTARARRSTPDGDA